MAYEDLLKDNSIAIENGNFFNVTITDLDINTSYPLQFKWKYNNGTQSPWSAVRIITTPGESTPATPSTLTVVGGAGLIAVTWDGKDANGNIISNIDRIDLYIDGQPFDATKPADFMLTAGTKTITAPSGTYIVAAYAVSKANTKSAINDPVTVIVTEITEPIQTPISPSSLGFSSTRVLSGITVTWDGSYATAWTGFQAINIYAGNSANLTNGTYIKVGQMTANKISNTITIPVDGTYVRYDLPIYIHASSVNKNGIESSLVANVTNQSSGARSAIGSDLADTIISNAKLVNDAVTAAKIATDAVTSVKIIANAITSEKIISSAITTDKIATNAITAGKIKAGEIDVTKLSAGTISVNNLEAGNINSTSYIRAGSGNTGARVEISSATISDGPSAGFYIYNSAGTAVLSAPLSGGLSIIGEGTFTGSLSIGSSNAIFKAEPTTGIWLGNATYASAPFSVSKNGVIKADSGTIGGWTLADSYLQNSAGTFQINSNVSTIYIGPYATSDHIRISASGGIQHTNSSGSATGKFTLSPNGNLTLSGAITITSGDTYNDIQTAKQDAASAISTANSASGVASSASSIAGTALQADGTYVTKNTSNQITKISTEGGLIITSKASGQGSRVELTNTGLYAYNGSSPMVQIDAVNGNATFTGKIEAKEGYFGSSISNYWTITEDGIISNGTAKIKVGNYAIKSVNGSDFSIYDENAAESVMYTTFKRYNIYGNEDVTGSTFIYRLSIGDSARQTELVKNAEISGDYNGSDQDYRSGGLRNMYTITTSAFNNNPTAFPDAGNGAVLLVYTP